MFDRRDFLVKSVSVFVGTATFSLLGCRGPTKARIKGEYEKDRVGSDKAGAEVFNPVVAAVVAKMIARVEATPMSPNMYAQVQYQDQNGYPVNPAPVRRITFISIENQSAEELGDYKDHIKEIISQKIGESPAFEMVSDKAVSAALRQSGLRPDDLFIPANLKHFRNEMGANGEFDYMLFAKLTSGSTQDNADMQRDYMLTLNLVDVNTYKEIKESEPISKEYLKSLRGKVGSWFKR